MAFFETSDGVKLYYQQKGEGQPIVLVHGWSSDHKTFDQPFEELSKKFNVVSFDLRGHGASDRPEHGLTLKRFASDLEELMEHLNLMNVTLVGHSMGVSTTFEYVKNFGVSRLKAVSLFDMTPKLVNEEDWNLGLYHGKYTREDSLNDLTVINDSLKEFAKPFFKVTVPYLTGEMMEEQLNLVVNGNTPHVLAAMWHAMAVGDYRDVLPQITVPTQIVYGEKSTLYSKETAEYMKEQIPNSEVIPFENCTHLLVAEDVVKTAKVIEELASSMVNS
ncbi:MULTISPECIES: alpha/beta fold hydrolase [Bacillaceae]|uniref:Alpha/beta hydrolase n=1 Tax=Psychrobacillus lasiicapitis TaxID=1636719 RepID=A0A544SWD3_9BACI|nr:MULTISPECIES: alpha/beta hydrolase [Bacillaceae]TQR09515.1 alpha/beta hydrolase [Psychrobacillus lasiicapitis]GGA49799.1 AB hydrolase superfamily protein YdjP [Psychrobacillus lasiicapitis]